MVRLKKLHWNNFSDIKIIIFNVKEPVSNRLFFISTYCISYFNNEFAIDPYRLIFNNQV